MRLITSTPSSVSTSPITSAVKRPLLASMWRASEGTHHSTGGCRNDVVDRRGVRLLQFRRVNFVMFSDGPMDAEYYRLGFPGQLRYAQGPLAAFDMGLRNVNHVTHDLLPPEASSTVTSLQDLFVL